MATIYPRSLPGYIRSNPLRRAECRVYDALREQLSEDFTVYYSRPWLGTKPNGEEVDGEADFVLAHPQFGLATLEVKGGGISRDGERDDWTSRSREGVTYRIKNPVQQARSSKYQLLNKLKAVPFWHGGYIPATYGVIFPDSSKPQTDLGADMPLHIFAFAEDMDILSEWLTSRMKGAAKADGPERDELGKDGLAALTHLLARSFELRVPFRSALAAGAQEIRLLTEQQYHILDFLRRVNRSVVEGGAGSGKTVLALEFAHRLDQEGMRTLLTCASVPLAKHLRAAAQLSGGSLVASFPDLVVASANKAGVMPASHQRRTSLETRLANLLIDAVAADRNLTFDAIIVDEGQDFPHEWLSALELALNDPISSQLHVFLDNNQRIYPRAYALVDAPTPPFPLTRNLRNSIQIFGLTRSYYVGGSYVAAGPEGQDIEFIPADPSVAERELTKVLGRLIKTESVPLRDIAVLTCDESRSTELREHLGSRYQVEPAGGESEALIVDSIARFKGLERGAVILVISEDVLDQPELVYVGLSRAMVYLAIIGSETTVRALKMKYEELRSRGEC